MSRGTPAKKRNSWFAKVRESAFFVCGAALVFSGLSHGAVNPKLQGVVGFWDMTQSAIFRNGHNTYRLVNLSDYKNSDERKSVWSTTMNDRYNTAVSAFADPDNNLLIRSGGLVLATAMVLPRFVEDTVSFVMESVHPAREFAVHSFLVVHEKDPVEKLRAAGKAGDNFAEFYFRAEAGATAAVTAGAMVVREGTPILRTVARSVSKLLEKPTALTPQPARSLGAAARADLADPALRTYDYVHPDGSVKPTSQNPTLNPSRAPPTSGNTMPDDLGFKNGRPLRSDEVQVSYGPARNRSTTESLAPPNLKKAAPQAQPMYEFRPGLQIKAIETKVPPLPKEVAVTFEKSDYRAVELSDDLIAFRGEGRAYGSWYGLEKPHSAAHAEKLYNVVDYGNDLMEISSYRIPKGTIVYGGKVAGGEGYQIYLKNSRSSGVEKLLTEGIPQNGF